jgi:DNA topoisomerase-1
MAPKYKKKYADSVFNKGTAEWLLIVESPSKCTKIEGYLGDKYKCIASNGHFRTIEGLKSIDKAKNYCPKFSLIPEKADHVKKMKDIIGQFPKSNIILATDDDREGEAIAWHICDTFDLSLETTIRIVFHEITDSAIRKSLVEQRRVNMDLVYAQFARQVLDILVGFRVSPVLWKYLYHNKDNGLSAGRCQTPALRLVYDCAMSPVETPKDTMYRLTGRFTSMNIEFQLSRELKDTDVCKFLQSSIGFRHILTINTPRDLIRHPPIPFNTSTLLQQASNNLRLSPKDVMALCQVLYQEGHITYMRTENTRYSDEFVQTAGAYISKQFGDKYIGILESTNDSNPHEAIRVTHIETRELVGKYEGKITSLYKMIWRNTIESCMSNAKYSVTECRINAPDNTHYVNNIESLVFAGWKAVTKEDISDDKHLFYFKSLRLGDPIKYNSLETHIILRTGVRHYTEASLIKKMEDLGIGRPSTFASLVEVIQDKKYVKLANIEGVNLSYTEYKLTDDKIETISVTKIVGAEKDKLIIQPIGIIIVEFLSKYFAELFSYGYTGSMEKRLDNVSRDNWHTICKECDDTIESLTKPLSNVTKEIYKIDTDHDVIFTKNGPVIRSNQSGETKFESIKNEITLDIERLKHGEYALDDILQEKTRIIGEIDGSQVTVKNGRFGMYAEWGDNKQSLKTIKKSMADITLEDVTSFAKDTPAGGNILRVLDNEFSIRKGKFGPYAFYQRADMPKPSFLNIKKFKESFSYCNEETLIKWLCETYNICR